MGKVPGLYSDISKKTRDLLHKDRSSNNVKFRPDAPPGLVITSSMKNGVYMSTISTQLKERNVTADINFKLGKHPNISSANYLFFVAILLSILLPLVSAIHHLPSIFVSTLTVYSGCYSYTVVIASQVLNKIITSSCYFLNQESDLSSLCKIILIPFVCMNKSLCVDLHVDPQIFTNIVLDQRHLLPGLKAICNFNAFEPKSQMIEQLENKIRLVVDVRDVAESLLMVYEKPEAEGRYICTAYTVNTQDLVKMLKRFYPEHEYPKSFTAAAAGEKHSSEKLQTLGWSFRPLEIFL
ncbi:hypothetical protein POM88_050135 [Heracleum sosnowskyi]|uniref:Uncharacterized protein n=1 Tax=Heracleum sosnowskyi TaxID=360622 RepID=A0AAD8GZ52_9APIA|nr:hypothetical protein POM88_050135 [Heracleum sosnowskyi]